MNEPMLMSCDECSAAYVDNESHSCPVCKLRGEIDEEQLKEGTSKSMRSLIQSLGDSLQEVEGAKAKLSVEVLACPECKLVRGHNGLWYELANTPLTRPAVPPELLRCKECFEPLQVLDPVVPQEEETETTEEILREALSDVQHEIWSSWMRWMFDQGRYGISGTWSMPVTLVERWKRQMNTPYSELTEKEKDSDREQADKTLEVINGAKYGRPGHSPPPPKENPDERD